LARANRRFSPKIITECEEKCVQLFDCQQNCLPLQPDWEKSLSKDILLDSFTITTARKERQQILGLPRTWAQASRILLWLVVSREAYGECLRFFRN